MQTLCSLCQEKRKKELTRLREINRLEKRRSTSANKWQNVRRICKCGQEFPVPMYKDSLKFCPECKEISKKLHELSSRSRTKDGVKLSWVQLHDMLLAQDRKCALTGMRMTGKGLLAVSADRLDNSKLHTIDNIHLVCKWVNLARCNHTIDEIRDVLRNFKNL